MSSTSSIPTTPNPAGSAPSGSSVVTNVADAATRTVQAVAGAVPDQARKVATSIAGTAVDFVADEATSRAKQAVDVLVMGRLKDLLFAINLLPIVGDTILNKIVAVLHPTILKIHPNTKLTPQVIFSHLKSGRPEFLEGEVMDALQSLIKSQLNDSDRAKLEKGDKLVLLKAFGNKLYEEAQAALAVAKGPGGIAKALGLVSRLIPYSSKLSKAAQPVAGGALLLGGIYIGWKIFKTALKWIALIGGPIAAYKMWSAKAGAAHPMPA